MAVPTKGRSLLFNFVTNKGTAFTRREREELDLAGLLPPKVATMQEQLERTYENFSGKTTYIEKFIYLAALQDRNETLYYRLLLDDAHCLYSGGWRSLPEIFTHLPQRARCLCKL